MVYPISPSFQPPTMLAIVLQAEHFVLSAFIPVALQLLSHAHLTTLNQELIQRFVSLAE